MDLDLEEYDQVEEIKFIVENGGTLGQVYCDSSAVNAANSNFVVSLSSCSDQASLDESDFIFIPELVKNSSTTNELQPSCKLFGKPIALPIASTNSSSPTCQATDTKLRYHQASDSQQLYYHQASRHNLLQNTGNPFQRCLAVDQKQQQQPISADFSQLDIHTKRLETPDKPVGLLKGSPKSPTDPSKLTGLLQQIVTRSDSILIVIPCSYCNQSISCQPSDVTSWLRHMDSQHNSRVCPICAKLIGLGYTRDINIMRRHVLEHIDDKWLSNQPTKTNFTFGLQQQWFSEIGCAVRDSRNK